MAERELISFNTIELVSTDGTKIARIQLKNNTTIPASTDGEINDIVLKGDFAAGGKLGWVKTDATTWKEFGAIDA